MLSAQYMKMLQFEVTIMTRDDIRGSERCPAEIEAYLQNIGGRTPFGEPMWRLVLAGNVIWKVAGGKVWEEQLSVAESGGFGREEGRRHENRPFGERADRAGEQKADPPVP